MTKAKQNKSILYLLAIALMVAIMSVACKNKHDILKIKAF